jgi:hypothetical protein
LRARDALRPAQPVDQCKRIGGRDAAAPGNVTVRAHEHSGCPWISAASASSMVTARSGMFPDRLFLDRFAAMKNGGVWPD